MIWDGKPIYIVLDNVERLIAIERHKKNLEKMFIIADMVAPMISILIIHDTYIDEVDAFSKSLFNEYNFTPFVLNPMDNESMKAVVTEKYFNVQQVDEEEKEKFKNFFNYVQQNFSKQTVNIKKWLFICKLLFNVFKVEKHGKFKKILSHVAENFYENIIDINDIKADMERVKEEQEQKKCEALTKVSHIC